MLETREHEVVPFTDGREALAYIKSHPDVAAVITSAPVHAIHTLRGIAGVAPGHAPGFGRPARAARRSSSHILPSQTDAADITRRSRGLSFILFLRLLISHFPIRP